MIFRTRRRKRKQKKLYGPCFPQFDSFERLHPPPLYEEDGSFFGGLGPRFFHDGDTLLLQYLDEDLDLSLVQVDGTFANDLFTYVARERQRVRRA